MFSTRPHLLPISPSLITTLVLSLTLVAGCVQRGINQQNLSQAYALPTPGKLSLPRININTASADELEKLPGIGQGLAKRIIEHREKYGPFRKPEHLIIVRGISDKRFHALQNLITVE